MDIANLFQPFESLPFDDRCAEEYGILRADFTSRGILIGANDMMIAATAIAYQCNLVTHNVKEFARVVRLQMVDWEI